MKIHGQPISFLSSVPQNGATAPTVVAMELDLSQASGEEATERAAQGCSTVEEPNSKYHIASLIKPPPGENK